MQYKREELFSSDVQIFGRVTCEGSAKAWSLIPNHSKQELLSFIISLRGTVKTHREFLPLKWNRQTRSSVCSICFFLPPPPPRMRPRLLYISAACARARCQQSSGRSKKKASTERFKNGTFPI